MANRSGRLYFGVSDTPKGNLVKEVIIRNPGDLTDEDELDLQVGDELIVKFNNGNNEEVYPQLKLMVNDPAQDVGPTGAIPTVTYPGYNEWSAQQLVGFVYCCGKIAGDIITDVDAEFDQDQTATASFTSEETFLNEVQSTPGTYQFTYHVAEVEEAEETEEATGAWYLNEQIVNLTVYGISCENPADEDTIIINVAYVEEHTEDETYYWKAFQIDKATADTYGVTKLVTDANDLTGEDDERPVGWNVIDDEIDEKLSHLTLSYDDPTVSSGSTIPTDWGTINLNRPDESISSITLSPAISNTNQLTNGGAPGTGGNYWSSQTNNYFDENTNSLGIGYHYNAQLNHDNAGSIRTIIPSYLDVTNAMDPKRKTTMGYGNLDAYQHEVKNYNNELVAPNPYTEMYGNDLLFGMGTDYYINNGIRPHTEEQSSGIRPTITWSTFKNAVDNMPGVYNFVYKTVNDTTGWYLGDTLVTLSNYGIVPSESYTPQQNNYIEITYGNGLNRQGGTANSEIRFGIMNTRPDQDQFVDLFWMNGESANFEVPVNINNGININNIALDTYVDERASTIVRNQINPRLRLYHVTTSTWLKYKPDSSIPEGFETGNLEMNIPDLTGASPGYEVIGIVGFNVNRKNSTYNAGDFSVWECYLNHSEQKIHYGLRNCSPKFVDEVKLQVTLLYARDGFLWNRQNWDE